MTTSEVFRRSAELMQAGDLDGWLALCADDIVFEFPFAPPGRPARIEGKTALSDYVRRRARRMAAPTVEAMRIHVTEDPEVIVAEATVRGADSQSRQAIAVVTVHQGRITGYRDYWSPLTLTQPAM